MRCKVKPPSASSNVTLYFGEMQYCCREGSSPKNHVEVSRSIIIHSIGSSLSTVLWQEEFPVSSAASVIFEQRCSDTPSKQGRKPAAKAASYPSPTLPMKSIYLSSGEIGCVHRSGVSERLLGSCPDVELYGIFLSLSNLLLCYQASVYIRCEGYGQLSSIRYVIWKMARQM